MNFILIIIMHNMLKNLKLSGGFCCSYEACFQIFYVFKQIAIVPLTLFMWDEVKTKEKSIK